MATGSIGGDGNVTRGDDAVSAKFKTEVEINSLYLHRMTGIRMVANKPLEVEGVVCYVTTFFVDTEGSEQPFELCAFSDEKQTLGIYSPGELDWEGRVKEEANESA